MSRDVWNLELKYKPDFLESMKRINAWYQNEIVDRPPVQFKMISPRPAMTAIETSVSSDELKNKWFDADEVIENFERQIDKISFQGETFPVFWPNLGPVVYSAFYGSEVVFETTTAWSEHLPNWEDVYALRFDENNEYFKQIEKMTRIALERAEGKYMVGYTDLHPGMDCV